MIALERRYRVLLRVLPVEYRQRWEQDMVGTFLQTEHARLPDDDADLGMFGRRWPPLSEIVSIARLAVGVRLGTAGPFPSPRAVAWGTAVRLVALFGLLVLAAFALAVVPTALIGSAEVPRNQIVLTVAIGAAWIASYVCLVLGRLVWAKTVGVTALLVTVVSDLLVQVSYGVPDAELLPYGLAMAIPVVALVAWQPTVAPAPRWWLIALPTATAILVIVNVPGWFGVVVSWDLAGSLCLAAVCSAVILPVMVKRKMVSALSCALAVALLGISAAIVRGLSLVVMLSAPGRFEGWGYLLLGIAIQCVSAAILATIAVIQARRFLRTVPPSFRQMETQDVR